MLVLGIETSCDETAVGIVDSGRRMLANVVASQASIHARYGGVVPEVASRHHLEAMTPVVKAALAEANGDTDEATTILRKRGLAQATKKAGRSTNEGLIGHYIHMGGKIGVLVGLHVPVVGRSDGSVRAVLDQISAGVRTVAAVTGGGGEHQGQVAGMAGGNEASFERDEKFLGRAYADEARDADGVAVTNDRDRIVWADNLAQHLTPAR